MNASVIHFNLLPAWLWILLGFGSGMVLRGEKWLGGYASLKRRMYRPAKIQSCGITVNGCFILGLDGDTCNDFEDVLNSVRDSQLYQVQVTFMTAFPGTPLYARLKAENCILRDRAWELCPLFDINFQPRNMGVAELKTGFLSLVKTLYSAEETLLRRANFRRRLRTSTNFGRRSAKHVPLLVG